MEAEETTEPFHWDRTREVLGELGRRHALRLDERRRAFRAPALCVTPPLVFPVAGSVTDVGSYLETLPDAPGLQLVILLQAGAASLGLFRHGEELATKSIKKYVVRGSGRAQPTYLKSKGKSRYGSRLRLQNARKLLVEINQRLDGWLVDHGRPDQFYFNAPVRLWPDLFASRAAPPFDRDEPWIKLPWDLPVPTTVVLLKTYRRMGYGKVVRLL